MQQQPDSQREPEQQPQGQRGQRAGEATRGAEVTFEKNAVTQCLYQAYLCHGTIKKILIDQSIIIEKKPS